jgi:N-acetylglucosaminyldiphosphoundecaprenol N-acetyl-beta-D-mannosaminyltransferase
VLSLAKRAAERGWSIYLLGGAPGAADRAAAVLQFRHAKLKMAGTCCPAMGFEKDPAAMRELREKVAAAKPDIVYVALGFPKQERVIQELRSVLPRATFIGVGISLSFIAGEVKRAPRWVQRAGLEWVHRLVQEPRRLAKRYLVDDAPFALFRLFPRAIAQRWNDDGGGERPATSPSWQARLGAERPVNAPGRRRNPRDVRRSEDERRDTRRRAGDAVKSAHEGHE